MPKTIARKIIALQCRFLWGKQDGVRGIPVVKWDLVQKLKYLVGLGVGDIAIKNTALLFKW